MKSDISCSYSRGSKKRGPRAGYIESLETRLKEMEALFQPLQEFEKSLSKVADEASAGANETPSNALTKVNGPSPALSVLGGKQNGQRKGVSSLSSFIGGDQNCKFDHANGNGWGEKAFILLHVQHPHPLFLLELEQDILLSIPSFF